MSRNLFRTILILTLVHTLGTMAMAQGTTGNILGVVYDQSQAVLPGVNITARDDTTGVARQAVTDDEGRYVIAQLRIGQYVVEAQLPGFQRSIREVTLSLRGDAVIDFVLSVGAAETEVVVTGEAPLVETTSSSLKGFVDNQQIRDLPLNGRSFTDLAGLQTGVSINYNQLSIDNASTAKFNINGSRSTQQSFTLDGTEMKNSWGMTPGSVAGTLLGVDTIQEFSVTTSVATAEHGGFTGGVVSAVTRSGTNDFHGTVFAFHRNSALDARNFFDRNPSDPLTRSDPPEFKRNQYGFTLGGPIMQDKLFFFGSFEGLNERLPATQTSQVPTLDARNGIYTPGLCTSLGLGTSCNVTPDPLIQPILDTYPAPNGPVVGGSFDSIADLIWANPRSVDQYYYMGKIDWQASDQDSVAGRYVMDDSSITSLGDSFGLVGQTSETRNQYMMLQWNRVISTSLVNEAKVSFNRSPIVTDPVFDESLCCPDIMRYNPNITTRGGQPRPGEVSITGAIDVLGISMRRGRVIFQNRFQYLDNLSYTRGAHSMKMGFNIHRIQLNYEASSFAAGQYTWNNIRELVTNSTPRVFIGTLSGAIMRGMRHTMVHLYFQDDWRVNPNFTLNLGVRYEPYKIPNEVAGRISNTREFTDTTMTVGNPLFEGNPTWSNFSPRIGFAWDLFGDGKTSIRGGYGLFFDLLQPYHYFNHSSLNLPFSQSITRTDPPFPDPSVGLPPQGGKTAPQVISNNVEQAGVHQYQLSIQRELAQGFFVQVDYRGARGYNLGHLMDRNYAIPETDANGVFPFWPAGNSRPNPSFTRLRDFAWDAASFYNSLGLTVKKRFSQGWSLQGNYTYAKSIDDASSSSVADTGGTPNGATHFPFDITFDRGLSGFDVRNRFVLNGSFDLPFGRGRAVGSGWGGATNAILGGWSINGILTAADGNHGTVQLNRNFNNSRSQANDGVSDPVDRPNLIPGGNNNPVLADGRDPNNYFDASQFVVGPPGYLGDLARGTIENPGILTVDFSIFKDINIDETRYFQFRAEFFNILNRANFHQVGTSFGGNIWLFNTSGNVIPGATRITSTATTARQIQFALKFHF